MHLYYRLLSFVSDNLLTADSPLLHNGKKYTKTETLSPTTERMIVLRWMKLIDSRLPSMKLRYFSHELKLRTLKDLQPQISDAIPDLLAQLNNEESVNIGYVNNRKPKRSKFQPRSNKKSKRPKCMLCVEAGNSQTRHSILDCPQLSRTEKDEILAQAINLESGDSSSSSDDDKE